MTEDSVLRLIVSLLFIVALILACAWIARRAGWAQTGGQRAVKVLGTQSLGARTHVTVVEVEDARLVLGVTTNQITLLHTLPPSAPDTLTTPQAATEPPSFAAALGKVMKRR